MAEAVVNVRVIPRARHSAVADRRGDAWVIRLQAPPVDGAANEALVAFVAETLGLPKRAVMLVSGWTSRQKRLRIDGIDAAAATERLTHAMAARRNSTARS